MMNQVKTQRATTIKKLMFAGLMNLSDSFFRCAVVLTINSVQYCKQQSTHPLDFSNVALRTTTTCIKAASLRTKC